MSDTNIDGYTQLTADITTAVGNDYGVYLLPLFLTVAVLLLGIRLMKIASK